MLIFPNNSLLVVFFGYTFVSPFVMVKMSKLMYYQQPSVGLLIIYIRIWLTAAAFLFLLFLLFCIIIYNMLIIIIICLLLYIIIIINRDIIFFIRIIYIIRAIIIIYVLWCIVHVPNTITSYNRVRHYYYIHDARCITFY